jgi:hypothetical protein
MFWTFVPKSKKKFEKKTKKKTYSTMRTASFPRKKERAPQAPGHHHRHSPCCTRKMSHFPHFFLLSVTITRFTIPNYTASDQPTYKSTKQMYHKNSCQVSHIRPTSQISERLIGHVRPPIQILERLTGHVRLPIQTYSGF